MAGLMSGGGASATAGGSAGLSNSAGTGGIPSGGDGQAPL
jgi:hypothetical protein